MRKLLAVVFRLIAILLGALTVLTTIFVMIWLSVSQTLLNPQTYRQVFAAKKVPERLAVVMAQEFTLVKSLLVKPCVESSNGNHCPEGQVNTSQSNQAAGEKGLGTEGTAFINALDQDQWKALVRYLLPPNDIQESTESAAGEIIAYFKGERDSAGMPLIYLRARLKNMTDEELTLLLLNSQPSCSLEQQTLIMAGETAVAGSSPIFCAATGGSSQVLVLDLHRRLGILASEIPDYFIFIKPPAPPNPSGLQRFIGKDLRATFQMLQASSEYLPLVPVLLLILVTTLSVRSLRGLLRSWGIPIFIAGLFSLIAGAVLFFAFDWIWLTYLFPFHPSILNSGFGTIIHDIVQALSREFSIQLMFQAGIVTALAFGVILLSNRVPAPPDPSLPPLAPPGTPGGPVLNANRKRKKW